MSNVVLIGIGMNVVVYVSKVGVIELLVYFKILEVNGLGYFDDEVWQYVQCEGW